MKLGVVGHAAEKFTRVTRSRAEQAISDACDRYKPTHIVSGRSPMGGVDLWAEDVCRELELIPVIHPPKVNQWDGPGGFKDRNLAIARDSDLVLVVVVRELPPGFTGMRFDGPCYHCARHHPCDQPGPHVKSGACWTAWKAKAREWSIV